MVWATCKNAVLQYIVQVVPFGNFLKEKVDEG